jgi:hypothetical protein
MGVECPRNASRLTVGRWKLCFLLLFVVRVSVPIILTAQSPAHRDLTQASLEGLMNVEVTSVSKKEQKLSRTGVAVSF